MMKYGVAIFSLIVGGMILAGCSKKVADTATPSVTADAVTGATERTFNAQASAVRALPSVIIYRMTGDYAQYVPVTLRMTGELLSYPDPMDINESQAPVALGNGWYLDRRGVGLNTAFLDYTYEQYHALERVPSQTTLLEHILVKKGIAEYYDCGKERRTIDQYRQLVQDGFPDCILVK